MRFSYAFTLSYLALMIIAAINQFFYGIEACQTVLALGLIALTMSVRIRDDLITRFYSWI